jgi:hypothetical protein
MVEILNFKKIATIIKLNAPVTNLNTMGIIMGEIKTQKIYH